MVSERFISDPFLVNEELYKALAQHTTNSIAILKPEGIFSFVNPALAQLTGYREVDLWGQLIYHYLHPSDRPTVATLLQEASQEVGSKGPLEVRFQHRNGSWLYLEIKLNNLLDHPNIQGLFVSFHDVTRHRQTEQRLAVQYAVTAILAKGTTIPAVIPAILQAIGENLEWEVGEFWGADWETGNLHCTISWQMPGATVSDFVADSKQFSFPLKASELYSLYGKGQFLWEANLRVNNQFPLAQLAIQSGLYVAFGLPILDGEEVRGVLLFFSQATCYSDNDLHQMSEALGNQISLFLNRTHSEAERVRLYEIERHYRFEAEESQRRQTFLAQAVQLLSSSLDDHDTLDQMVNLTVPALADWCAVQLLDEKQAFYTVAVAQSDPTKIEFVSQLEQHYPLDPNASYGPIQVLRSGKPEFIPDIPEALLESIPRGSSHLQFLHTLKMKSYMCLPLIARGRTFGAITLVLTKSQPPNPSPGQPQRRFNSSDLAMMEELAQQMAVAIDNARLYQEVQAANQSKEDALALLDTILQVTPVGLSFLDTELRYVRVNEAMAALNHRPIEEHLGRPITEVFPRLSLILEPPLQRVLETGEPLLDWEVNLETPKGRRSALVSYFPVRVGSGEIKGVGAALVDITARKRAEEALRQSEERFKAFMENSPAGAWIIDEAGKILYFSKALAQMTNLVADTAIGKTIFDIFPAEFAQQYADVTQVVSETDQLMETTESFLRPDGTLGKALVYRFPILNPSGQPLIGGVVVDITERVRAEEALRESEERFRFLAENASDLIIRGTLEGVCTYMSPACRNLLGYEPEELIGKAAFEFTHPQDQENLRESFAIALKEGVGTLAYRTCRKDGSYIWVETSIQTARYVVSESETGNPPYIIAVVRDISERKKIEEALEAEKERLAVTLRSIGDGVITTDTEGNIRLINRVAEELTGWNEAEAVGHSLAQVFQVLDPKTRQAWKNLVNNTLKSGQISELFPNSILVSKDGRERLVEDTIAPIHDQQGQITGVVVVFRDSTEKQKITEELLKASKLEAIGLLAGGIAHDFNNILTSILGNLSLASVGADPEEVVSCLAEAEKSTYRARDLTQQLLTFSKGGAPVKKLAKLTEIIEDSAQFVLRGSRVSCDFNLPTQLWPLEADSGQLSQVIQNLVINAAQAMPTGGTIHLVAENVVVEEGEILHLKRGKYVKLAVKDLGIGIPPEHLTKIFDPYFTTKEQGSGLGLAICYSIVQKHEGVIKVESALGVGTTVYLYLPASTDRTPLKPEGYTSVGRGRVLVMDDDHAIRHLLKTILKKRGYQVEEAEEGLGAIALYQAARESSLPIDVVILDITIPGGMGGEETIKRLLEVDPSVKAIVSSGYSDDPIMANFRDYGFLGVIKKPYTLAELEQVLGTVLKLEVKKD
ncbi:MAG: PAS domain S-box protein [Chloroflexota bacterium]